MPDTPVQADTVLVIVVLELITGSWVTWMLGAVTWLVFGKLELMVSSVTLDLSQLSPWLLSPPHSGITL